MCIRQKDSKVPKGVIIRTVTHVTLAQSSSEHWVCGNILSDIQLYLVLVGILVHFSTLVE